MLSAKIHESSRAPIWSYPKWYPHFVFVRMPYHYDDADVDRTSNGLAFKMFRPLDSIVTISAECLVSVIF